MLKNKEDNRTLTRMGARELSSAEYAEVGGGFIHTGLCTFNQKTHSFDRDCEPPPP